MVQELDVTSRSEASRKPIDPVEIVAREICSRSVKNSTRIPERDHQRAIDGAWHLCAEEAAALLSALAVSGLVIVAREKVEFAANVLDELNGRVRSCVDGRDIVAGKFADAASIADQLRASQKVRLDGSSHKISNP